MNYGGDAADQIVRYSLEGTEVALKLTGEAAKTLRCSRRQCSGIRKKCMAKPI